MFKLSLSMISTEWDRSFSAMSILAPSDLIRMTWSSVLMKSFFKEGIPSSPEDFALSFPGAKGGGLDPIVIHDPLDPITLEMDWNPRPGHQGRDIPTYTGGGQEYLSSPLLWRHKVFIKPGNIQLPQLGIIPVAVDTQTEGYYGKGYDDERYQSIECYSFLARYLVSNTTL